MPYFFKAHTLQQSISLTYFQSKCTYPVYVQEKNDIDLCCNLYAHEGSTITMKVGLLASNELLASILYRVD